MKSSKHCRGVDQKEQILPWLSKLEDLFKQGLCGPKVTHTDCRESREKVSVWLHEGKSICLGIGELPLGSLARVFVAAVECECPAVCIPERGANHRICGLFDQVRRSSMFGNRLGDPITAHRNNQFRI